MNVKTLFFILPWVTLSSCTTFIGIQHVESEALIAEKKYERTLVLYKKDYARMDGVANNRESKDKLIAAWGQLAQYYYPAKKTLEFKRNNLMKRFFHSKNGNDFHTFITINEAIFQNQITYDEYEKLYRVNTEIAEAYLPDILQHLTKLNACVETNPHFSHDKLNDSNMRGTDFGRGATKAPVIVDRYQQSHFVAAGDQNFCRLVASIVLKEKLKNEVVSTQKMPTLYSCKAP